MTCSLSCCQPFSKNKVREHAVLSAMSSKATAGVSDWASELLVQLAPGHQATVIAEPWRGNLISSWLRL